MSEYLKRNKHFWLVLYVPVYLVLYIMLEKTIATDYAVSYIPLDDMIPFKEEFVIFYCLWYAELPLVGIILFLKAPEEFKNYMYFLMLGFTASILICTLVPNGQNLRPENFERENIYTYTVAAIYNIDTNTNVFPSMHVVGSVAVCCAAAAGIKYPSGLKICIITAAILSAASTVFIKQHSVLDVIGGVILCIPIWYLIYMYKNPQR